MTQTPAPKYWAIFSDFSGVTRLDRPEGGFATEVEALRRLVEHCEGECTDATARLRSARRKLTAAHLRSEKG